MRNNRGFSLVEIIIVLLVLSVIGVIIWQVISRTTDSNRNQTGSDASSVTWSYDGQKWQPSATPPRCPSPLLASPVDVSKATSMLMPGEIRGNNYKPHGGFRFDSSKSDEITVKLAMDATVTRGSRYIEQGEVQYMFDFINACGIMMRYDHLLTLSDDFKALADSLPEPRVDDSRTTNLEAKTFKAGDVIASAVGFKNSGNVGVDFGVYDLRNHNEASNNKDYAAAHKNEAELAYFAVCWFDMLGPDSTAVKQLAAGRTSDYCK